MKENSKRIIDLFKQLYDTDISTFDLSFLNKSVNKGMVENQCNSVEAFCNVLEQNRAKAEMFSESLHISYSEFFRNPLTFAVLERIILPSIALTNTENNRKEIRIWASACAAGQEAYSLAMVMEELRFGDPERYNYRIFATDQDESKVNQAQQGHYSTADINNLNFRRIKQWFTFNGDRYVVKPELKENIEFSVFDLFSENLSCPPGSIFGNFNLVVCANLLFYYKPGYREKIIEKTGSALANGGYLVSGETEREILMNYNYREVFPQSAIFRK